MISSPLRFEEAVRHSEMIQGRNQKPKGWFNVKHALQVTLLLVIGIWLLYQVKKKDYSDILLGSKVGISVDMGRKGNAGSNDQVDMDCRDGNNMFEEKSERITDKPAEGKVDSEKAEEPYKQTAKENAADHNKSDNGNDLKFSENDVAESKDSTWETRKDRAENISEVNGYQDENGIPPDGHESENNVYNLTINDVVPVTMVGGIGHVSDDQSEVADTNKITEDAEEVNNGRNDSGMSIHELIIEEEVSSEFADKYEKLSNNGTAEDSNSNLSEHQVEDTESED